VTTIFWYVIVRNLLADANLLEETPPPPSFCSKELGSNFLRNVATYSMYHIIWRHTQSRRWSLNRPIQNRTFHDCYELGIRVTVQRDIFL
jgi:hypothetical protein